MKTSIVSVRLISPKGTNFSKITDEQVAKVESLINNRPRKCLAYKTPLEVLLLLLHFDLECGSFSSKNS